jgi:CMP-N-acetylneuraminic acid synthetase
MDEFKLTCFLPCRSGSQRVKDKNTRRFSSEKGGLIAIKLRQLLRVDDVSEIVLSTNDSKVISIANSFDERRIRIHKRKDSLSSSVTSTDQLVPHALDLIGAGHILWTHVTSPFFNSEYYISVIKEYKAAIATGYDSLLTANPIRGFVWDNAGPINYDRSIEKWPRTQTLTPLYEVNSAAFIAHSDIFRKLGDRIGRAPYIHTTDKLAGFDIDWPEDFAVAEAILNSGIASI